MNMELQKQPKQNSLTQKVTLHFSCTAQVEWFRDKEELLWTYAEDGHWMH